MGEVADIKRKNYLRSRSSVANNTSGDDLAQLGEQSKTHRKYTYERVSVQRKRLCVDYGVGNGICSLKTRFARGLRCVAFAAYTESSQGGIFSEPTVQNLKQLRFSLHTSGAHTLW